MTDIEDAAEDAAEAKQQFAEEVEAALEEEYGTAVEVTTAEFGPSTGDDIRYEFALPALEDRATEVLGLDSEDVALTGTVYVPSAGGEL